MSTDMETAPNPLTEVKLVVASPACESAAPPLPSPIAMAGCVPVAAVLTLASPSSAGFWLIAGLTWKLPAAPRSSAGPMPNKALIEGPLPTRWVLSARTEMVEPGEPVAA